MKDTFTNSFAWQKETERFIAYVEENEISLNVIENNLSNRDEQIMPTDAAGCGDIGKQTAFQFLLFCLLDRLKRVELSSLSL